MCIRDSLLGWMKDSPLPGFEWFPTAGCLDEARLAYIGLRDVDEEEGKMLRASQCHVWTMRDVDRLGISGCIEQAVRAVDPHGVRPLHLSLDIDGIDPQFAPGTGTCARGGLTYREAHYICEELALTERLVRPRTSAHLSQFWRNSGAIRRNSLTPRPPSLRSASTSWR